MAFNMKTSQKVQAKKARTNDSSRGATRCLIEWIIRPLPTIVLYTRFFVFLWLLDMNVGHHHHHHHRCQPERRPHSPSTPSARAYRESSRPGMSHRREKASNKVPRGKGEVDMKGASRGIVVSLMMEERASGCALMHPDPRSRLTSRRRQPTESASAAGATGGCKGLPGTPAGR